MFKLRPVKVTIGASFESPVRVTIKLCISVSPSQSLLHGIDLTHPKTFDLELGKSSHKEFSSIANH